MKPNYIKVKTKKEKSQTLKPFSKAKSKAKKHKDKFELLIDLILKNNEVVVEERNTKHYPLDLLILLILNQSTTDLLADRAFLNLKATYKNYEEILQENDAEKLREAIKICGLAPRKAKYILNALAYLKERNWLDINMDFINSMTDEEALKAITRIKGVGIKSASCLLMFSFKRGTFPVDTHLFRILKRIGGLFPTGSSVEQVHKILQPKILGETSFKVHVSLIELGRQICKAPQKPLCEQCYLRSVCDYFLDIN
ncbi:MAG: hypothetical protein SFU25_01230 [Candidatus Caenarcaniphilales bacterium]|nr:hypothetical protein [Candidatus Caenarcaniphilales bacterium]